MRMPLYVQMEQSVRSAKYPKDRICFLNTDAAAEADKATFRAWQNGAISAQTACERIAVANALVTVTEEQFMNECKLLGYARHIKRY